MNEEVIAISEQLIEETINQIILEENEKEEPISIEEDAEIFNEEVE